MEASYFTAITAIIIGLVFLVWAADRFVDGASGIASNLGVSPLLIGLTIVGFGTSAPEILVSLVSTLQGFPGIAVGNAVGSNITNIALVLGLTAIIAPITVQSNILRREYPVMMLIMVTGYILIFDGILNLFDSVILLSGLLLLMLWTIKIGLKPNKNNAALNNAGQDDTLQQNFEQQKNQLSLMRSVLWLVIGMLFLIASSKALVWGSIFIAQQLGMSDLLIGLTIIAIGTSLPELATSISSALKNEHEIAVGNIIGSNMFNILAVLGIPGLITTHQLDPLVIQRDYPIMLILAVLLGLMAFAYKRNGRINRIEGGLLLFAYISYMSVLYINSTQ